MLKITFLFFLFFSITSNANVASDAIKANKGNVVLLDFWASWCGPCKASFPWMNEMQKKYSSRGLKIITINVDEEKKLAEEFLKKYPADFQVIYDPKGISAEAYDLQAMPTSFLFNSSGEQKYKHLGFREKETKDYEKKIVQLLGASE